MFPRSFLRARRALALVALALLGACDDRVAGPTPNAPTADRGAATLAWNRVARDLVAKNGTSAPASIRTFALLSVAQYNAVVEAGREPASRASARGAVAGASAAVLASVYPQDAAALEALASQQRAEPAADAAESFPAGETIGRGVAGRLIARAHDDRFSAPFTGTVPTCPGCWVAVPTPPAFATLGQAKPYFLARNAQFRPAPPPTFGSAAFQTDLAEVRRVADTRTAVQDSIAKFWALPVGTVGAQGQFNVVAAELMAKYPQTEREAAHTFALLNMAAYDAIVASHEAKYHYWLIRPSQADPGIVRAIGLPSFPAYPSNHSALAGVAAGVLAARFPAERARLDAMAEEAGMSRLYGGIHYRFDITAGLALGRQVAAWTLRHDVASNAPFVLP